MHSNSSAITAVCEHCVTDIEEVEGTCYRCIKISLSRNLKYIKKNFNWVNFFSPGNTEL